MPFGPQHAMQSFHCHCLANGQCQRTTNYTSSTDTDALLAVPMDILYYCELSFFTKPKSKTYNYGNDSIVVH